MASVHMKKMCTCPPFFSPAIIPNSIRDSKSLQQLVTLKAFHSRILLAEKRSWLWVLTKNSWEAPFLPRVWIFFSSCIIVQTHWRSSLHWRKSWIGGVSKWNSNHSLKFMTQQVLQTGEADKLTVHNQPRTKIAVSLELLTIQGEKYSL